MKFSDYLKHKKSKKLFFGIQIIAKIILFLSLFIFALGFIEPGLISYRNFYGKNVLPFLLILLFCFEIHKIDSKKAKTHRHLKEFEITLQEQEFDFQIMTPPIYEHLTACYADAKIKEWVEFYVNQAIKNFEEDRSLSLYSLLLFEKEIKNNWEKYEGRTVSTIGFVPSIVYNFTFIAYPLYQFASESIDSSSSIYKKIDENNFFSIPYYALVFRSKENFPLKQALEMVNIQSFTSDYKQVEFDPGTKVILNGTLDMDEKGNLTIINCEITRYTPDIHETIKKEQLNN